MNSLFVIHPRKSGGTWIFDDESRGLVREPFVGLTNNAIDDLVKEIPDAVNGFDLLFSTQEFPGYTGKFNWLREEYGGNTYFHEQTGHESWLCPQLLAYLNPAPQFIYAKAEPSS